MVPPLFFVTDMPRAKRAGLKRKREAPAPAAAAVPAPPQPSAVAVPAPAVLQVTQTLAERTTRTLGVYMLIASHTQGSTALLDYAKAHYIDWSAFVGDWTLLAHLFVRRETACDAALLPLARGPGVTLDAWSAARRASASAYGAAICLEHPGWAFDLAYNLPAKRKDLFKPALLLRLLSTSCDLVTDPTGSLTASFDDRAVKILARVGAQPPVDTEILRAAVRYRRIRFLVALVPRLPEIDVSSVALLPAEPLPPIPMTRTATPSDTAVRDVLKVLRECAAEYYKCLPQEVHRATSIDNDCAAIIASFVSPLAFRND